MAYKRRRLSRFRFRRRRRFNRRNTRRAKGFIKRVVKRMSELKWQVKSQGATPNNFNNLTGNGYGFFNELTPDIDQGPTSTQRIGNRIQYKNLKVNLYFSSLAGSLVDYFHLRIIIFIPRGITDFTDAQSVWSSLFDGAPGNWNQWLQTIDNRNVHILKDKVISLTDPDAYLESGIPVRRLFRWNFRLRNNVSYRTGQDTLPIEWKDRIFLFVTWPNMAGNNQFLCNYFFWTRISFRDF